jgi:hypothetical protein
MLKHRWSRALLLLALSMNVSACEPRQPSDLADLLPGVEPFEQLDKVTLDMTAEELERVRPSVANAPYIGFKDSIGGYGVAFQFPRNVRDNMETPKDDRLASVRASRVFGSEAEADTAFRREVAVMKNALGDRAECFRIVPASNTVHFARWTTDSAFVYVQYATADGPPGSDAARALPARVSTLVAREALTLPQRISPVTEPCPSK